MEEEMGEGWGELDTATLSTGGLQGSQAVSEHCCTKRQNSTDGRVVSEMHSHGGEQGRNMEYIETHQDWGQILGVLESKQHQQSSAMDLESHPVRYPCKQQAESSQRRQNWAYHPVLQHQQPPPTILLALPCIIRLAKAISLSTMTRQWRFKVYSRWPIWFPTCHR